MLRMLSDFLRISIRTSFHANRFLKAFIELVFIVGEIRDIVHRASCGIRDILPVVIYILSDKVTEFIYELDILLSFSHFVETKYSIYLLLYFRNILKDSRLDLLSINYIWYFVYP